jgi:hypothetical protein
MFTTERNRELTSEDCKNIGVEVGVAGGLSNHFLYGRTYTVVYHSEIARN